MCVFCVFRVGLIDFHRILRAGGLVMIAAK